MIVKVISRLFDILHRRILWFWYNATTFMWSKPLPWSTRIYGRINRQALPVRLRMGKNGQISDNVFIQTTDTSQIVLGDHVSINVGSLLVAMECIEIGANTAIAEYVSIRDQDHISEPENGTKGGKFTIAPVKIGKNSWIGRGVYIGKGTTIGENCIVGANSVVHGSFPPFTLIAGAPAKVRKVLPGAPEEVRLAFEKEKSVS